MPSDEVTQVLEERRVGEVSRLLYVASGVLNMRQVRLQLTSDDGELVYS